MTPGHDTSRTPGGAAAPGRPGWWSLGALALGGALLACASPGQAQRVDPVRGADPGVDYASLVELGPWDDRNYRLTEEDLALLAENEAEQTDAIPVFFRVQLRRANPELRRSGPAQYPRSALQTFFQACGGYLIGGRFYREVTREGGRFVVPLEAPSTPADELSVAPGCAVTED